MMAVEEIRTAFEVTVNQNTMILWGGWIGRARISKHSILELLPSSKIIEIENCAHFSNIEPPEISVKAIDGVAKPVG